MTDEQKIASYSLIAYRIGDTHCLTPGRAIEAVMSIPATDLTQVPGTKPWVIGASKLNRELIPFINTSRFLSIASQTVTQGQPVLIVRGAQEVGCVGLLVDKIIGFFKTGDFTDVANSSLRIPPGLGGSLCGVVDNNGQQWALIDLQLFISDSKLQKIDLN